MKNMAGKLLEPVGRVQELRVVSKSVVYPLVVGQGRCTQSPTESHGEEVRCGSSYLGVGMEGTLVFYCDITLFTKMAPIWPKPLLK